MNRNIYIFSLCLLTSYGLQAAEKPADMPKDYTPIVFINTTKENMPDVISAIISGALKALQETNSQKKSTEKKDLNSKN